MLRIGHRSISTNIKVVGNDEDNSGVFDRSGMTSKSAFIKARIFGEPFHVVIFDKSQHEYYARLSDLHAQFRMVGNRSAFGRFACKEL